MDLVINLSEADERELVDRLSEHWNVRIRALEARVDALVSAAGATWAEGDRRVAGALNANPRWRRTVDFFLDHRVFRKTRGMEEWRKACGTDGRLWKTTRGLGWERLWRILLESRRMRNGDANRGCVR